MTFDHQCEQYLRYIDNPKYRRALFQFRVSSHVLEIEQGRYHGIPREQPSQECDITANSQ